MNLASGDAYSLAVVIEDSAEKNVKVHSEGIDGEGKATKVDFTANFDGKDYPATGIAAGDMVSVERVDSNILRVSMKKGGQTVMTVTSVVSGRRKVANVHVCGQRRCRPRREERSGIRQRVVRHDRRGCGGPSEELPEGRFFWEACGNHSGFTPATTELHVLPERLTF